MKWEPNIAGHPIRFRQKQTEPPTMGIAVDEASPLPSTRVSDNDNIALSVNVMLAHYQRDRR